MNLPDEKLNLLHELADITGPGYSATNVFPRIRSLVLDLLDCDSLIFFTNDQEQRVLTAANAFNNLSSSFNNLTIPYSDTLVVDLLVNRQQATRLAPEKPVLPTAKAELFVPIQTITQTLGCLYLAREEENAFSPAERKLLHLALGYIGIAIERSSLEKQQADILDGKQKHKAITKSFLESLQQPAIIIDTLRDQVYEVNPAFAELLNYGKAELLKAPFTTICRDYLSVKNLSPQVKQNLVTHWATRDNSILNLNTVYTFLDNIDTGLLLLIFQQEQKPDTSNAFWLHELFAALSQAESDASSINMQPSAGIILNTFGAAAITVHSVNNSEYNPLLSAYTLSGQLALPADDKLNRLFNSGNMAALLKDNKPVYIPDLDKVNKKTLFPLTKAGFKSLASVPLEMNTEYIGRLVLYFDKPAALNNRDKIKLGSISRLLSNFIFAPRFKSELYDLRTRQNLIDLLTRELFAPQKMEQAVLSMARELSNAIPFDYFSLTLFDDTGKIKDTIDMTWPDHVKKFDPPLKYSAKTENALLRVHQTVKQKSNANSMQPLRLPFAMPAHTSVVLINGDRYLGNFALGRLEKKPFTPGEIDTLKQLSVILSAAVAGRGNPGKTSPTLPSQSLMEKMDALDLPKVTKQELVQTGCGAMQSIFNAQMCKFVFMQDKSRLLELFDWLSKPVLDRLSPEKIKKMLVELKKSKKPILFTDYSTFVQILCKDNKPDPRNSFQPFVLCPLVKQQQINVLMMLVIPERTDKDNHLLEKLSWHVDLIDHYLQMHDRFEEYKDQLASLNDYTHMVSHELKSPLQTIKNYASIIKEDVGNTVPPEIRQYISRLLLNLDNMEQLIMELLTLSRLDKSQLEKEKVDTRQVVADAIESLHALIKHSNAQIMIDEPLPVMQANRTGLEQIFTNLISNAIKYTRESTTPMVSLTAMQENKNVIFTVSDNGIGIPKADQDKVFQPFFKQNDNSRHKSTGLGLAIVKKIVQLHNGAIRIESSPGNGSTFIISIPIE